MTDGETDSTISNCSVKLYGSVKPMLCYFVVSGEIVRNDLGGHDTATLVAFKPRIRLVGESAVSMATSSPKDTATAVHTMAGTSYRYRTSFALLMDRLS